MVYSERFKLFSRRILKRYEDGCVSPRFHTSQSLPEFREFGTVQGNTDVAEDCAIAQFFPADEGRNHSLTSPVPINMSVARNSGHQIECSVFIEFMEIRHASERILAACVRL